MPIHQRGKSACFSLFLNEAQQFGNSASDSKALNSEWLRSTKTWAETRKHCERRNTEGGGSLRLFVSFPPFVQKPCIGDAQSIEKKFIGVFAFQGVDLRCKGARVLLLAVKSSVAPKWMTLSYIVFKGGLEHCWMILKVNPHDSDRSSKRVDLRSIPKAQRLSQSKIKQSATLSFCSSFSRYGC